MQTKALRSSRPVTTIFNDQIISYRNLVEIDLTIFHKLWNWPNTRDKLQPFKNDIAYHFDKVPLDLLLADDWLFFTPNQSMALFTPIYTGMPQNFSKINSNFYPFHYFPFKHLEPSNSIAAPISAPILPIFELIFAIINSLLTLFAFYIYKKTKNLLRPTFEEGSGVYTEMSTVFSNV